MALCHQFEFRSSDRKYKVVNEGRNEVPPPIWFEMGHFIVDQCVPLDWNMRADPETSEKIT